MPDFRDEAIKERDQALKELEHLRYRQYNVRQECKRLRRQLTDLQLEERSVYDLKRELKAQKSNMARIKFNGKRAAQERDGLLAAIEQHRNWCEEERAEPAVANHALYRLAREIRAAQTSEPPNA